MLSFLTFVLFALAGAASGWLVGRGLGRFEGSLPAVALGLVLTLSFAGWLGLTVWLEAGLRAALAAWFLCIALGLVAFSRTRRRASDSSDE